MIRAIRPEDKPILTEWIKADPVHCDLLNADFFYAPRTDCLVIEKQGAPVLFYRLSRSLRVDIQFDQDRRIATAAGLLEGCNDLKSRAPKAGFAELIFDTQHSALARFAERRLGFWASPHEYRCTLGGA